MNAERMNAKMDEFVHSKHVFTIGGGKVAGLCKSKKNIRVLV